MHEGLYALQSYIAAEEQKRAWKAWYLQERWYYYSKIWPSIDISFGRYSSLPVEKAVIFVLETEENCKRHIKPLQRKCKLLQDCLKILSDKEKAAFNCVVWGDPCELQEKEIQRLYKQAIPKLCDYIEKNHLERKAV